MGLGKLLLGDGRLPDFVLAGIEDEGALFVEEGLLAMMTSRGLQTPGLRRSLELSFNVQPVRVGLGVSEKRLILFSRSGKRKLVDVPFAMPNQARVAVSSRDGKLVVDAHDINEGSDTGGKMRLRSSTANATAISQAVGVRLADSGASR
jgi:hypothetical protein